MWIGRTLTLSLVGGPNLTNYPAWLHHLPDGRVWISYPGHTILPPDPPQYNTRIGDSSIINDVVVVVWWCDVMWGESDEH